MQITHLTYKLRTVWDNWQLPLDIPEVHCGNPFNVFHHFNVYFPFLSEEEANALRHLITDIKTIMITDAIF